jgi:uncharacterized protein (TIGR03437 family)
MGFMWRWILTISFIISKQTHGQSFLIDNFAGGVMPIVQSASTAVVGRTEAIAIGPLGTIYFSDFCCIYRLDTSGTVTRIGGNGRPGYSGDGGPAVMAQLLPNLNGLAISPSGDIYFLDGDTRIRRIDGSGVITTVAGTGINGSATDGTPATKARLGNPAGLAIDGAGNLFFSEPFNLNVREVPASGIMKTVTGEGGFPPISIFASYSSAPAPAGVAFDAAGNLYLVTTSSKRIYKLDSTGTVTTIAGLGTGPSAGNGGLAVTASIQPLGALASTPSGDLYFTDTAGVRKISQGTISTFAGSGLILTSLGDGGLAVNASLSAQAGLAADGNGNVYIADQGESRIRVVGKDGIISTAAGGGIPPSSDGQPSTTVQLTPGGRVASDSAGNLYISDATHFSVRRVSPSGVISTVAGNGTQGLAAVSGQATKVALSFPRGITIDSADNLFIVDGSFVRKVTPDGILTTIAGNGQVSYSGDGQIAAAASIGGPSDIALDSAGNIYLSYQVAPCIRKIDTRGVITTIAGTGISGDPVHDPTTVPAMQATFYLPSAMAVDADGNIYIADNTPMVRKLTPGGLITKVVGNGLVSASGDGGPGLNASIGLVTGLALDRSGNLFIADQSGRQIRKLSKAGIITTVAGNGGLGEVGDGGLALAAQFYSPAYLATDPNGNVYVADNATGRIRKLTPTSDPIIVSAILDAASETAVPATPGKIMVIYGQGMGPSTLVVNQPVNGTFGTQAGGSSISFNGTLAPVIYSSATQLAVIAPYEISGASSAIVNVNYAGKVSSGFSIPVAGSSPSFFSANGSGAGQIAAVNQDGSLNDAAHPAKIGSYVSFYATGEGLTAPGGVDGQLANTPPYPSPILPVHLMIGGAPVTPAYAGAAPTEVAGLMQIVAQVPAVSAAGGYVPVVLQIGDASTAPGATWIAVAGN